MHDGARQAPHAPILSARVRVAVREFERRRAELSAASLRLIDASVELRDARDAEFILRGS